MRKLIVFLLLAVAGSAFGQSVQQSGTTSLPLAKARMWPSINQVISATAPWNAVDPWGNAISCAGTNSQCLQEFFNVTTANGWPAEVDCRGTGAEPITIQSSASVTVPVAQDWSFHSYGCNLNFNLATASGLIFDSTEFDWDGKIVLKPALRVHRPGRRASHGPDRG